MQESLALFKQVCNNTLFGDNVSMILFLNKKDIFEEKIKNQSIRVCFTDYQGIIIVFMAFFLIEKITSIS